jgi:hypothetical protein
MRAAAIGFLAAALLSAYLATHKIGYVAYYAGPEPYPRIELWSTAGMWRWGVLSAGTPVLVGLLAPAWLPAAMGVWLAEGGAVLWLLPPNSVLSAVIFLSMLVVADVSLTGIGVLLAGCVRVLRRRAQRNR